MPERDDDRRACPSFSGTRGEAYLRWKRDAKMHLNAEFIREQDDNSLWKTALGLDQGGDAQGAPPLPANPAGLQAAQRKRVARDAKLHKELYNAQEDERLKSAIGDIDENVVNNQGPGRRAWLLLERECSEAMTDLVIRTILTKFNQPVKYMIIVEAELPRL